MKFLHSHYRQPQRRAGNLCNRTAVRHTHGRQPFGEHRGWLVIRHSCGSPGPERNERTDAGRLRENRQWTTASGKSIIC